MRRRALVILGVLLLVAPAAATRTQGSYTACKSNLKNLGTALEMYSTDSSGRYPHLLAHVSPGYLKTLPRCPEGGHDYLYERAEKPDAYTLICAGRAHEDVVGAFDVAYTSVRGIEERFQGPTLPPDVQERIRKRIAWNRVQRRLDRLSGDPLVVLGVGVSLLAALWLLLGALVRPVPRS